MLALVVAFVMPGYSILKRVANGRDELAVSALKAEGQALVPPVQARAVAGLLGITWQSGELPLQATLQVHFPGRCRLELTSAAGGKSLTASWAQGRKSTQGGDFAALGVAVEQACNALASRSGTEGETRAGYERWLSGLKVDTRSTSLGRFSGLVTYVLGERKDGASQFWVYKDRFLPARVRSTDASGTTWDVRFIDYTAQATGDFWPRALEVYRGTELELRVALLSGDAHADLEGVKF
jgi:hypothetical protein